jgi:hypothetical protein
MDRSRKAPAAAHAVVKFQVLKDGVFSSAHDAPMPTSALVYRGVRP